MNRVIFFVACMLIGVAIGGWWSAGKRELPFSMLPFGQLSNNSPDNQDLPIFPDPDKHLPPFLSDHSRELTSETTDTPPYTPMVVSYHDGIMRVAPSVVSLYSRATQNDTQGRSGSQGSGVIVDSNGIVLTNLHLVEGQDLITVVLSDGRSFPAVLIGSDRETDLAVVRINAQNLPFLRLDEAKPLRVGDIVLAIGNPFGVGQTVTQGIVSATRRRVAGGSVWQNFIQTDAAINPGNSGGALINPYGQLVGVNTAVFRGESGAVGIGFSIPADLLAQVVPQIIENGSVARGWLGINVEDLTMYPVLQRMAMKGAIVTSIDKNSPASRGGLQPMDVVIRLGEQAIDNATQLLLRVSAVPPGATVKLTVLRSTSVASLTDSTRTAELKEVDLKMRLGTRPSS